MNNLKILIKKLSNHARVALEKSANSCINGFVAQRFHNYMILKVLIIF